LKKEKKAVLGKGGKYEKPLNAFYDKTS